MHCIIEDCDRGADVGRRGMCQKHYLQWWRATPNTPRKKSEPHINRQGYIELWINGVKHLQHRLLAEKALCKPLPSEAEVHHMNEDKADNFTPYNLVICPNSEYHKLLHKRMRELGYANNKNA